MSRLLLPVAAVFFLGLAACAAPSTDEQEQALAQAEQRAAEAAEPAPVMAESADAASCDPLQAQWVVGKPVGESEAEQARKDAGAKSARILKPGQVVTMEFNAARLNIDVDEKGIGVATRCG